MNDIASRIAAKAFKWVGTRPIRPDGVPKVTGPRAVRLRLRDAGHAGRPHPALAARPCAHPLDRHLEGRGAARRQGGGHLRGLPRAEVRVCRPGARRAEFLAHDAQHHGAREGALRGPSGCGGRGHQQGDRRRGAGADRGRLRGAAARHRRRRGDEAGRAAAVRRHDHARRRDRRPAPSNIAKRNRVQSRRHRGRASRRPTRSSRCRSRPPPCIRPISSRRAASPASTPTARPSCGARARGTSSCAPTRRSCST